MKETSDFDLWFAQWRTDIAERHMPLKTICEEAFEAGQIRENTPENADRPPCETATDAPQMHDLVIRLRSDRPFIGPGDWYTIDGRPGLHLCGTLRSTEDHSKPRDPLPMFFCTFAIPTHRCALTHGHTTPHQMVQVAGGTLRREWVTNRGEPFTNLEGNQSLRLSPQR